MRHEYTPIFLAFTSRTTSKLATNRASVFFIHGIYVGVSKSFETSSTERQPMAVCEYAGCAWEQGTSPLSMPSGVVV